VVHKFPAGQARDTAASEADFVAKRISGLKSAQKIISNLEKNPAYDDSQLEGFDKKLFQGFKSQSNASLAAQFEANETELARLEARSAELEQIRSYSLAQAYEAQQKLRNISPEDYSDFAYLRSKRDLLKPQLVEAEEALQFEMRSTARGLVTALSYTVHDFSITMGQKGGAYMQDLHLKGLLMTGGAVVMTLAAVSQIHESVASEIRIQNDLSAQKSNISYSMQVPGGDMKVLTNKGFDFNYNYPLPEVLVNKPAPVTATSETNQTMKIDWSNYGEEVHHPSGISK
jgi:hypothetical protein